MATFTIKRKKEYNNHLKDFKIFVDGHLIGTIANGEVKNFEVPSGKHRVIAKIDWCSSSEISIDVSDSKPTKLAVNGFKNGNWLLPAVLVTLTVHFILQRTLDFHYFGFLSLPFLLVYGYFLTFGRKKYLVLKEID